MAMNASNTPTSMWEDTAPAPTPPVIDVRKYSSPIGVITYVLMIAWTAPALVLMWRRRKRFPLNVAPFWLQAAVVGGAPITMMASSVDSIFYNPSCLVIMAWFFPTIGWVPWCPGVLVLLWYVQACYYVQLFRAKIASPSDYKLGELYLKTITQPWQVQKQFAIVSACISLPPLTFQAVDYLAFDRVGREDCAVVWLPAKWSSVILQCGLATFVIYIGLSLRNIQEEFQLTKGFARVAIVFFSSGIPIRTFNVVLGHLIPREALMWTKTVEVIAWFLCFCMLVFSVGYNPWRLSYRLQRTSSSSSLQTFQQQQQIQPRASQVAAVTDTPATSGVIKKEIASVSSPPSSGQRRRVAAIGDLKTVLVVVENRKIFRDYLVKEFAVENILYFESLLQYRSCTSIAEKLQMLDSIRLEYLETTSLNQINIAMKLRVIMRTEIASLCSSKGRPQQNYGSDHFQKQVEAMEELLQSSEKEILKMLLDPFNRCLRQHPEICLP